MPSGVSWKKIRSLCVTTHLIYQEASEIDCDWTLVNRSFQMLWFCPFSYNSGIHSPLPLFFMKVSFHSHALCYFTNTVRLGHHTSRISTFVQYSLHLSSAHCVRSKSRLTKWLMYDVILCHMERILIFLKIILINKLQ